MSEAQAADADAVEFIAAEAGAGERRSVVLDLPIEIIVSVGAARLCVHELMSLKRDQIVSLDKRVCDPVDIFVGERLVARGELVDLDGEDGEIEVVLNDPFGNAVHDVNPPSLRSDGSLEWVWSADYDDHIGTYTVHLSSPSSGTVGYNFTVEEGSGPFVVVQRLAAAISAQDWDTAAAIDARIRDELEQEGVEFLEDEYPDFGEKHWVPYDSSGQSNALGTTIIGAYVIYLEDADETFAFCEVWAVDPGDETMRSGKLPILGDNQERVSLSGRHSPSSFGEWLSDRCVAAANPESS